MSGPTQAQHRAMHALWREAGVVDRAARLALTGAVVGRRLGSSTELTEAEADQLIAYMRQLKDDGVLAERAAGFLGREAA
jgi:hypothetical protein